MKTIKTILSCLFLLTMVCACKEEIAMEGYLALKVNTLQSTQSRAAAPSDYEAKQLYLAIKNEAGIVVKQTNDVMNDPNFREAIALLPGTYTIEAHSFNWDGSDAGFDTPYYSGSTQVTIRSNEMNQAELVCKLANVKVTVNYDQQIANNFQAATTTIQSALDGIQGLDFVMNQTTQSGYIPVGNFTANVRLTNKQGQVNEKLLTFDNVKAREHYIINIRLANQGYLGDNVNQGFNVTVDESTNTYTWTIEIPQKSANSMTARAANAWSNFALLSGNITSKDASFTNSGITIQWKEQAAIEWNELANSNIQIDNEDKISCKLTGLTPNTAYEYRIRYTNVDNEVVSNSISFTTEAQTALYNGGFENWYMDGKVAYACESGVSYWDTSNKGASSFGGSNTTQETGADYVHSGTSSAKLQSKYIVIKFAAASLYTGQFGALIGTSGAWLNWGVPFASRPTALHGFMKYSPANVDRVGKNLPADAPAKGQPDQCGMYIALLSERLRVDNTDMSTFPDWKTDSRVIAYGELPQADNVNTGSDWKEVNIPLVYNDITRQPSHLLIVFSASKYGDYFHGGTNSTLYVDDFELLYGDNPVQ